MKVSLILTSLLFLGLSLGRSPAFAVDPPASDPNAKPAAVTGAATGTDLGNVNQLTTTGGKMQGRVNQGMQQVSGQAADLAAQTQAANSMNQANLANATTAQHNAEGNTAAADFQGANQAGSLGGSQQMLGIGLLAAGAATPCTPSPPSGVVPPCPPILAAGALMMTMAGKSFNAQNQLVNTGNYAVCQQGNLGNGQTCNPGGVTSLPGGNTTGSGVALKAGGVGSGVDLGSSDVPSSVSALYSGLKASGISTDGYGNAADMASLRKKFPNVSSAMWDAAMKQANDMMADPNSKAAKDLLAKLGKNGDLALAAFKDVNKVGGDVSELAKGDAQSATPVSSDFLAGLGDGEQAEGNSLANDLQDGENSKGANKSAERGLASYSEKTIFQRVSLEYAKQTPSMLNVDYFIRQKLQQKPKDIRESLKQGG